MTFALYVIAALILAVLIIWLRKPKTHTEPDYSESEADGRFISSMWLNGNRTDF